MNKNKKREFKKTPTLDVKNIKEYKVKEETTLLEFLLTKISGQGRNAIKGMLKHHLVSVDGAPITQFDFRLVKDDVVIVSKRPIRGKKEFLSKPPIIYEDNEIIVINKPSGLLSIASDKEKGKTAYRMVTDYVQRDNPHNRIYVVHRLDEDTSGILMFAKNSELQEALQARWNDLVKDRGYYAIVDGVLKEKKGTIKSYLKTNSLQLMYSSDDKKHGKLAITHYEVIKENDDYSLLDVHIDSGRKNQIRVHLGDIGHNVIGDDKYGEPTNPISRLGLHAYSLKIIHPVTKKLMSFSAPMPIIFNDIFKKINIKQTQSQKPKK